MFQQRHASESEIQSPLKKEGGQLPCPLCRNSVHLQSDRWAQLCESPGDTTLGEISRKGRQTIKRQEQGQKNNLRERAQDVVEGMKTGQGNFWTSRRQVYILQQR